MATSKTDYSERRSRGNRAETIPEYQLPTYSDSPSNVSTADPSPSLTGLPNIDYHKYAIPESSLSSDQTVTTTNLAFLSSSPAALEDLIREQAALPPRQLIRITGTRKNGYESLVDFDLKLDMLAFIARDKADGWNYIKIVEDNEKAFRGGTTEALEPVAKGGLNEWVQHFCRDHSKLKMYV